jgi:hypothetical protein
MVWLCLQVPQPDGGDLDLPFLCLAVHSTAKTALHIDGRRASLFANTGSVKSVYPVSQNARLQTYAVN